MAKEDKQKVYTRDQ